MTSYTPDERSKAGRLPKRAQYDQELIHGIVNEAAILHVSFNPPAKDGPQFPTILPMLGCIKTFSSDSEAHVYLHGSSVARLSRMTEGTELPLCIAATLVDGYVLALSPFHNSCNYRSAVVFGYGTIVADPEEVEFALRSITNNSIPDRWENSRQPATKAEMTATAVLKVRIETASGKTRTGGPSDDKADLNNADVLAKTWIGVVPTYLTFGEPVAGEHNRVKQVPEELSMP